MKNLVELLSLELLQQLSLPSNFKYGEAIFDRHAVELIRKGPLKAEAWVGGLDGKMIEGGGARRRTQLYATPEGLAWHCTGNPKNHDIFCKHCVALALALMSNK
ncbi:MAG TPA: hypothetical protein VLF69_02790 [Candidatus Saccharimonadales bacterium]|nr:hypothetical protein [Candidatus Saccharimonadales bacterium]